MEGEAGGGGESCSTSHTCGSGGAAWQEVWAGAGEPHSDSHLEVS